MRLIDADALMEIYADRMSVVADRYSPDSSECGILSGAMKLLSVQPTIEPEPQWIPCKERLPEDGRQVLVYARSVHFALAKYDEMRNADGIYSMQWVTFDAWKPFYTIKEVIAWRELPEPYKEGE